MPDGLGAVLLRLIVAEAGAGRRMLPLALQGAWLRRCPGWLQTAKELAAAPEMLRSTASERPPTPDLKRTAVRTVAEGSRSGGCAPGLALEDSGALSQRDDASNQGGSPQLRDECSCVGFHG